MCISRARILQLIFQNVMCLIGEYPYFVVYYLMETFFQRVGTLAAMAWGMGIIYLLYYILKYLNGIASFLVHMAGMYQNACFFSFYVVFLNTSTNTSTAYKVLILDCCI